VTVGTVGAELPAIGGALLRGQAEYWREALS
jgi:hypothetical protein